MGKNKATYLTVVFRINNPKKFRKQSKLFHEKMTDDKNAPWSVSAMSRDDEMTRINIIEEILESDSCAYEKGDAIGRALETMDIANKTAKDFTE